MKRWAVGFYSTFDNVLTIEIVTGPTWVDAVQAHSGIDADFDRTSLEKAKEDFFNCDAGLDVVEIP